MAMIYAFAALCLFGGALAQVPSLGRCPKVETVPDFDVSRYLGRWYEAEKYFAIFEIGSKCVTADYSLGDNDTITMVHSRVSVITGKKSSATAIARVPDPNEPGKLKLRYLSTILGRERDYWILGTDYETYAVVYSCSNLLLTHVKFAWILTRDQNPSSSIIMEAYNVVKKNNLSTSDFIVTEQNECPEDKPLSSHDEKKLE